MSALADKFKTEGEARLNEVRKNREQVEKEISEITEKRLTPLVAEEQEITDELARLTGQVSANGTGTSGTPGRRGRPPAGTPSRKDQVMELVRASGSTGITISEMQRKLDMSNPNYLYRVTGKDLKDQLTKLDNGRFVIAS